MIYRKISKTVLETAKKYLVVTLIGPRQSGKTTLVKSLFPSYAYCNLENPEVRALAETDPKQFFRIYPSPLIVDEVQRVPELLSWIQLKVDEDSTKGQYILTGSHQLKLHEAITQSLAGRTAILKLLPFSLSEIGASTEKFTKEDYLLNGFMPRIYSDQLNPTEAYRNYFETYVERDVRQLIQLKNVRLFETFIKLLAGRVGQPINLNSLSNDVGVSSTTLNEWISILEASFILYPLKPYYENFGKRLIKSSKIYFIETGLLSWLLGIETVDQMMRDPLHGHIFENMIITNALKERYHQGHSDNLYFWRDNNQNEIDLILEQQRNLLPIEIKSSMTWNNNFSKGIHWFQKNITASMPKGYVIYSGDMELKNDKEDVIHYKNMDRIFS